MMPPHRTVAGPQYFRHQECTNGCSPWRARPKGGRGRHRAGRLLYERYWSCGAVNLNLAHASDRSLAAPLEQSADRWPRQEPANRLSCAPPDSGLFSSRSPEQF